MSACSTPASGASSDSSPNREKIGLPALLSTKMCLRCNAQEALSGPSSSYRFSRDTLSAAGSSSRASDNTARSIAG